MYGQIEREIDAMESEWVDTDAGTHFRGDSGDTITKQMWREASNTKRVGTSLRTAAVQALGGKCSCCGEDDWNVLDIDHINCDGKTERRAGAKDAMERSIVKMVVRESISYYAPIVTARKPLQI